MKTDYVMEERMSQVKNLSGWCELMNLDDCEKVLLGATSTEGVDETGQKMVVSGSQSDEIAVFDACNPRQQTIALPNHPDPDIRTWPTCTRALRCGGCCTSDVFSCEPTQTADKYVKVVDSRLPYIGSHRFEFVGVRMVKITEHMQCDAQCRIKAHECHQYQQYDARNCRCLCRPERLNLQSTCKDGQIWDDSECSCICPNRNTVSCPEPSYFSTTTCKCTLKTSVAGEIDLDKLFEQLDKGLFDSDILLKNGQENDQNPSNEIAILTGEQPSNFSVNTESEGTTTEGDRTISRVEAAKQIGDFEGSPIEILQQEDVDQTDESNSTIATTTETEIGVEDGNATEETPTTTTTTTTPTPTTTTSQTTTTKASTTTKDPCAAKRCFGVWKARQLSNGSCQCFPPSPTG